MMQCYYSYMQPSPLRSSAFHPLPQKQTSFSNFFKYDAHSFNNDKNSRSFNNYSIKLTNFNNNDSLFTKEIHYDSSYNTKQLNIAFDSDALSPKHKSLGEKIPIKTYFTMDANIAQSSQQQQQIQNTPTPTTTNDITTSFVQPSSSSPLHRSSFMFSNPTQINVINNVIVHINNNNNNNNQRKKQPSSSLSLVLLKHKRKRALSKRTKCKSLHNTTNNSNKPKLKPKLKKKDKTLIPISLNQISINNTSLNNFPIITLPNDLTEIHLLRRMFLEENYFTLNNKVNNIQCTPIQEQKLNNKTFFTFYLNELTRKNITLYPLEETTTQNDNVHSILRSYYAKIVSTVFTIQKNYIGKKKNSLNKEQCVILHKLIQSCNDITDIIISDKTLGIVKAKHKRKEGMKLGFEYKCEFCGKGFEKGQGLGGHMSRNHPNQSEKYKVKMGIREMRKGKRMKLRQTQEMFLMKIGMNGMEMTRKERMQALKGRKKEFNEFQKEYKEGSVIKPIVVVNDNDNGNVNDLNVLHCG